jgi:hypothetical protein
VERRRLRKRVDSRIPSWKFFSLSTWKILCHFLQLMWLWEKSLSFGFFPHK